METLQKSHHHHCGPSPLHHHHSSKYESDTNLTPFLPGPAITNKWLRVNRGVHDQRLRKYPLVQEACRARGVDVLPRASFLLQSRVLSPLPATSRPLAPSSRRGAQTVESHH